jgi:integrase
VSANGGRSFIAQYTLHGVKRRVPLGSCAALPLAKAREAAAAVMGDVAKGRNPAAERKEATAKAKHARNRLTLGSLIDAWQRLHLSKRRSRYSAEATRALRSAFQRYLERAAEDLDRATVVRVLDALRGSAGKASKQRGGEVMATRTAAYGRAAFEWAVRRGSLSINPFDKLPMPSAAPTRERVLSDDDLASVLKAASETSAPYGHIVRMLALTGQRRDEVASMTWAEVSADLSTWTLPGTRTKNGAPHMVPLNKSAQELLRTLLPDTAEASKRQIEARQKSGALVFPSGSATAFSAWSKFKARLDKASGVDGWRLHDLRRTLATGFQRLGIRLEVTEAVLNHISGSRSGIVGVYQRHNWESEKRAALDAWANHISNIANPAANSNVVRAEFAKSATG